MLVKPPKLRKGDTIGIVSPSLPILPMFRKYYKLGKQELLVMGFKVKEAKNHDKVRWWSAGTPEQRAHDINRMFADKEVKAIIAQNGGQGAITVLEHLDYKLIKKNPKPFLGFSDATTIHSALYTKCHLTGFHMSLVTYNLGWVWNDILKESKVKERNPFVEILTNDRPLGNIKNETNWECWRGGKANGILFGGNLGPLNALVGTKYFPSNRRLKSSVLFWEIDGVDYFFIEKILYHLKYAGVLDQISGMVIGKLVDMKKMPWKGMKYPRAKELVLDLLKDYNFPILANVDFGHKSINLPMPIGIKVSLDASNKKLAFLESAVK
jgi:muramoyltetrapeptide carboxypeptidase